MPKPKQRLLQDREDNLRRGTCAHCASVTDFRYYTNPRGGWECLNCGVYFPAETWEWQDGMIARKHPQPKPRKVYFNKDAWAGNKPSDKVRHEDDAESPGEQAISETGLTREEFENL